MNLYPILFNKDGIIRVVGLEELFQTELVVLLPPLKGLTLSLSELIFGVAILSNEDTEEGELVERSFTGLMIFVGFHFIGNQTINYNFLQCFFLIFNFYFTKFFSRELFRTQFFFTVNFKK